MHSSTLHVLADCNCLHLANGALQGMSDMKTPLASHTHAAHAPPLPFTQAYHAGPAEPLPAAQAACLSPSLGTSHGAPRATLALPDAQATPVTPALPTLHADISPPSSLLTASPARRQGQANEHRPSLPSRAVASTAPPHVPPLRHRHSPLCPCACSRLFCPGCSHGHRSFQRPRRHCCWRYCTISGICCACTKIEL